MTLANGGIDRRRVLQLIGMGTAAGLAGCQADEGGGGNGNGGGNLGERVPTLTFEYWSDRGGVTQAMEDFITVAEENLNEIGVQMEAVPKDTNTQIGDMVDDQRTHHLALWTHGATPDRLDPHEFVRRYGIDQAGGGSNVCQWVNCEQTTAAVSQANAQSTSEREELIKSAQQLQSEGAMAIPLFPYAAFSAYRTDVVEPGGLGQAGYSREGYISLIESQSTASDNTIVMAIPPDMAERRNLLTSPSTSGYTRANHTIWSTLLEYDENYELQPNLASDYSVENDGQKFTVTLDDGTFHNGDPITAEDVAFTYKFIFDNQQYFPYVVNPGYETIEAVDDKTVEFTVNSPYLPMVTKDFPQWGIVQKDHWTEQGALDDPEGFEPETINGSGPYQVESFQRGELVQLSPHDGHPVHSPNSNLTMRTYRDAQPAWNAIQQGDIHIALNVGAQRAEQAQEMDNMETVVVNPYTPYMVYPYCQKHPTQFQEFRWAVGMALDRQRMSDLALLGSVEPDLASGTAYMKSHPWRFDDAIENFTDQPQGDREGARQYLSDAGWGWDDNDNLHYPADKDLSPQWPQGETPGSTGNFPCVNEENEYIPPEER